MRMKYVTGIAAAFLATGVISGPFAHGGATGVVAERMNGMMMLQEQVKLLNPMFNGSAPLNDTAATMAAKMIVDHAGESMLDAFPEGSLDAPSEALSAIWTNWQTFADEALELEALGKELIESVAAVSNAPQPQAIATVAVPAEPEPFTEWDQMNLEVLLGLKSREELEEERRASIAAEFSEQISEQASRAPRLVFADIVATCSACHSQFRQ